MKTNIENSKFLKTCREQKIYNHTVGPESYNPRHILASMPLN